LSVRGPGRPAAAGMTGCARRRRPGSPERLKAAYRRAGRGYRLTGCVVPGARPASRAHERGEDERKRRGKQPSPGLHARPRLRGEYPGTMTWTRTAYPARLRCISAVNIAYRWSLSQPPRTGGRRPGRSAVATSASACRVRCGQPAAAGPGRSPDADLGSASSYLGGGAVCPVMAVQAHLPHSARTSLAT
jgi:hypothetical protein